MTTALPYAAPIAGPTNSLCEGSAITLTEATPGGVWASTNSHAYVGGGVVSALTGGLDTITYAVTNGCGTATAKYPIVINAFPNPGNILGIDHTCPGYTVTLANYSGGGTWSSSNSSVASISSSGLVLGVSTGETLISYTLKNSCGTSRAFFAFTVLQQSDCGAAGVNNVPEYRTLKIYPNPNNGAFTLELAENISKAVVTVYNLLGKILDTRICDEQKNSFSFSNMAPGTYIIRIQTSRAVYTEKMWVW